MPENESKENRKTRTSMYGALAKGKKVSVEEIMEGLRDKKDRI